jgi:hypothetical protein
MEVFAVTHYEDPNDPIVKKKRKERERVAEQKILDKEKRKLQRREEKKMLRELKKRSFVKTGPSRNEAGDEKPYEAYAPTESTATH